MRSLAGLLLAGSLVVSACGQSVGGEETPTTATSVPESTTVSTTATTQSSDPLPRLVQEAIADLSARLGVEDHSIRLIEAEAVTWPDGSLGCPEEGQLYTQALVDGYQISLSHGDRLFLYHSSNEGPAFLCPSDDEDGGHEFVPSPGFDT